MKSRIPFYCIASFCTLLLVGVDITLVTAPAYGRKETVPHKVVHHISSHGKVISHARQSKAQHLGRKHHSAAMTKPSSKRKAAVAGAGAAAAGLATHAGAKPSVEQNNIAPSPSLPQIDNKGSETGLPLPRFAALRADRVYMRRGPGERYPIDWVYHRRGYPVRIEREFGVWRLVEDLDGQKGWVHQVTLRGGRSFVIPGEAPSKNGAIKLPTTQHADSRVVAYLPEQNMLLRSQNHDVLLMSSQGADRKVVAVLKPGTVGTIKVCPQGSSWCHVTVRGYSGWLERQSLWGIQPNEIIQPG